MGFSLLESLGFSVVAGFTVDDAGCSVVGCVVGCLVVDSVVGSEEGSVEGCVVGVVAVVGIVGTVASDTTVNQ